MNSVNSKTVNLCIKILTAFLVFAPAFAWDVDMSRRKVDFERITDRNRLPASVEISSPVSLNLDELVLIPQPLQDIVILNTEKGFVPEMIHVRKGGTYRIHLVNTNNEKRNVSFILDGFAENHSTPFAQEKVFELKPQKTGEFGFHCPETSYRGRVIVVDTERKPASR